MREPAVPDERVEPSDAERSDAEPSDADRPDAEHLGAEPSVGAPSVGAPDDADVTTANRAGQPWHGRLISAARWAAPALLAYAAVRAIGLVILAIFAHHAGTGFWQLLDNRFDSIWYTRLADHGYDTTLPVKPNGTLATTNLTFFPLYPALIAITKTILFIPAPVAGLVVAWVAGLVAAWGIFAVGEHLHDRRTGVLLVVVWGVLPHAVVESMAYTETVFTALVAWTLLAVLRRHWLIATALTVLAGLTRPTATPLIAAVCLVALIAVIRRRDGWRPWVAMLVAPLGYLGYIAWIGHRLGRLDGYFYIQKNAWLITFDGGVDTFRTLKVVLTQPERLSLYVSLAVLALGVALLVLTYFDRQPLPLLVFSTVMIVLALGVSNYFWAKGRYLIPAFPLLLPVAIGLAKARPRTAAVVLITLTVISAWYGTYLTLVWKSSP